MINFPDELVLASRNRDKISELAEILAPLGIRLRSSLDFPELEEVEEDAPTLEGNALKKAWYTHEITGLPSLADDTGLEVEALNGAPGVLSARYAGPDAGYRDNLEKLIADLTGKRNRNARFRTVLALVTGGGTFVFNGICNGVILEAPLGEAGFGYDPVFLPDAHTETFAQMPAETKNRISHRGKAVRELIGFLEGIRGL